MAKTHPPYAPEFRRQMVELVRSGRSDLGRLAAGCKADIVFVRIDTPKAAPVYDPFKFLVHAASGDDVERVIVDGTTIVEHGKVLTIDVPEVVRQVNEASGRVRAKLDL